MKEELEIGDLVMLLKCGIPRQVPAGTLGLVINSYGEVSFSNDVTLQCVPHNNSHRQWPVKIVSKAKKSEI